MDEAAADRVIFRVVPDDVQSSEVIIGRTYTELPFIMYQKVDDTLTFTTKNDTQPFRNLSLGERSTITVEAAGETQVPVGTMKIVTAVHGETQFLLPIMNLGDKDFTVGKTMAIEQAVDDGQPTTNQRRKAKIERTDVNVGDEQSEEIIVDLLGVLNDYRDCVAVDANETGCYGELSMEIEELPGSKPLYSKPYSVSEAERKKIRDIVSEWRKIGVVTDTNSAYASPVLLVKKKTGETRMVVDYRRLNNQTVRMNFPLPNIDDHVALLARSKLFIVLDLAQGYLQLPIEPKDRHKTAFITPEETGEFTRMIFGLTNAPFYFTKMMQRVLGPLRNNVVLFYLDDVMIPGREWIDLKERFIMVLEALRKAGLTVRLSKCEFLKQRVTYLGFNISVDGIEPGERKLRAIEDFRRPCNVHEVRRFLGLAGFFRRFVEKFAWRAAPLYELLKAGKSFEWNENVEASFNDLKGDLKTIEICGVEEGNGSEIS